MKTTLFIVAVAVCFTCGCQQGQRQDSVLIDQTTISLDVALKLADDQAAKALAEASTRPIAPNGKTAGDPHWLFQQEQRTAAGKVLTLADYRRGVQVYTQDTRPVMFVHYSCRKDVGYYGGRTHFGILVFLDTGQTRWFGGR